MFDTVIDSDRVFGRQYLYMLADLASIRAPKMPPEGGAKFPANFLDGLTAQDSDGVAPSAIWGGASKGVIFALLKERAGQPVSTVIDINAAKQGKHLAATGLLVQSPEQALATLGEGATIYVMNSNYLDEIKTMSNNKFQYIEVDHG